MKNCKDCNETYPLTTEYFYKNKSSPDGFNPYCKECTKKRSRKWQLDNHEEYKLKMKKYNDLQQETNEKSRIDHRKRGREQRERGYFKEYYNENKDNFKKYRFNHMNKKHDILDKEWKSCKEYFNHSCAYCGISEVEAKETQGNALHMEHAVNKGNNDLSNCIPSCKNCNSQKWTKDFDEWYVEDNEKFNLVRYHKIIKWLENDYKLYIC